MTTRRLSTAVHSLVLILVTSIATTAAFPQEVKPAEATKLANAAEIKPSDPAAKTVEGVVQQKGAVTAADPAAKLINAAAKPAGGAAQPNGTVTMPPIGQSLVGVNVSAASSASPQAVFLGSASLDHPFQKTKSDGTIEDVKWFTGGELKIGGMSQPGSLANVSTQSAFASYLASATNATPDKIVQSVEASVHLSTKLFSFETHDGGFFDTAGTKPDDPKTIWTFSTLVKAGAITPLSPSQANPPVYFATQQIQTTQLPPFNYPWDPSCAVAQGKTPSCYVAFIPKDRSHFYRNYEAGFRIKFYGEDLGHNQLRYPGIFDITVGQDEYVTGGGLNGVVLHIGSTIPIPVFDGFYAFGSMDLALNGGGGGVPPLLLTPSPANLNLTYTSPSVYTIATQQPNRDRYSLGFGIDLVHLISSMKKPSKQS
jgi:hypothetical protein